ncbi:MAG: hypothetical protein A2W61_01530, partial [Deltaproteobacteria bacterium RIFCSPLOWO2_01_44_7]
MDLQTSFDKGSFKDREGRVFTSGGRIFRTLSQSAFDRMEVLEKDSRLQRLIDSRALIPSHLTTAKEVGFDPKLYGEVIMEHEKVPVVTYPYEWSFDMLRDAALLTLNLLESCLEMGLILKDATPFNILLHKNKMVFIDTLSIDYYTEGRPWEGYSQFCREFLFPLMLTAYKGVEFQSWLRGELKGLKASDLSHLFSWFDNFRKGVFTHVHLQAWLERSFARKDVAIRNSFNQQNYSKGQLLRIVKNLRRIIKTMRYKPSNSEWIRYDRENPYDASEEEKKRNFVQKAFAESTLHTIVDLGSNIGQYSAETNSSIKTIIAIDKDPACINHFYHRCKEWNTKAFYPVVVDLLSPTPAMGWGLQERQSLFERLKGDGFLALALVHHICIGGNVPLLEFVKLLKSFGNYGVVEWVGKEDKMVQRMLR